MANGAGKRGWAPRSLQGLALVASGCLSVSPLGVRSQTPPAPVVAFVPQTPWQWPLWPTGDGRLIGGSGFVTGYDWPAMVSPGLGLGALLFPSILGGSHLALPGTLPDWDPVIRPQIVWQLPKPSESPQASPSPAGSDRTASPSPQAQPPAPAPSPDVTWRWSKAGPTPVGVVRPLPLPKEAYLTTPWGPVTGQPGPWPSAAALLNLGFPTPDGSPVTTPLLTWFQLAGDRFRITLLDLVSRQVFTPPSIIASRLNLPLAVDPPLLLLGPFATEGRLSLVDLLTGGVDRLPELPPINSTSIFVGANMSQDGAVIVYATLNPPTSSRSANGGEQGMSSRVQMFDRRTRMMNALQRLNDNGPLIEPNIDPWARYLAVTAVRPGLGTDILLYDLITGLIDPLPEVNTGEPESTPSLSAGARFMAFVRDRGAGRKLYVFDRLTRGVDPVVDLDHIGPVVQGGISPDGFTISVTYYRNSELNRINYDRRTGMIDPLPELNTVGVNRFIDLERQGLAR